LILHCVIADNGHSGRCAIHQRLSAYV